MHEMAVSARAAVFARRPNRFQQLFDRIECLGYRASRQRAEDRSRKFFFLVADSFSGSPAFVGELDALRAAILRVGHPFDESAIHEASQVSSQRTRGDTESLPELTQSETTLGQRLEGGRLSDRHAATADVRSLGERETANQGTNGLPELARFVGGMRFHYLFV